MPAKKGLPQPIDRPLSRAYLREFKGWSTAYPPGISEPTSLRKMENVLVNRDGSLRVRPGLRYISRQVVGVEPETGWPAAPQYLRMVGTHEAYYLYDGRKAYLFAAYSIIDDRVQFYTAVEQPGAEGVMNVISLVEAGFDTSEWPGGMPTFTRDTKYVKYLQIDNKILALSDNGEPMIMFRVGEVKRAERIFSLDYPVWPGDTGPVAGDDNRLGGFLLTAGWINGPQNVKPVVGAGATQTFVADSLIGTGFVNNHHIGFFYTYSNELGESKPSQPLLIATKRPWGFWTTKTPEVAAAPEDAAFPSGILAYDMSKTADQILLVSRGNAATGFNAAVAAGATHWNIYMFAWSEQDSVPVEGQLILSKPLGPGATEDATGWAVIHQGLQPLGQTRPIPTFGNRENFTAPPRAGQGIVAADRMVLVNDPTAPAVIRWTTNRQGEYTDFNPLKGGGYKTLTSGNMQIPACVKLWQNPQSADTLTILNMGTDGHSTAYYMAPASVSSQSDNTVIMGFEETTATPGTVSPYGCEVANNALYHPLEDQLMKSTASNYNINHKSQTDMIADDWVRLLNKQNIVSCQHDQRLYYLVHNPKGQNLIQGAMGNEVWVFDLSTEAAGSWSRWRVQGVALRKIELEGRLLLSLIAPDGMYVFDDDYSVDDYVMPGPDYHDRVIGTRNIPWGIETNTQGANRAHDAWAHLQQVSLTLGNFTGQVYWGVRGRDIHGREINAAKATRKFEEVAPGELPFDQVDHLEVRRDMMEWVFWAQSVTLDGVTQHSSGQLNLVQYRYTPISVNVGYEYGSVETFEYGRGGLVEPGPWHNGTPEPFADTTRP